MCLHTILLDPHDSQRIFTAISAAGAFRSDDGGGTWRPVNRGLRSNNIPEPEAEVGHCVHRLAMHPSRSGVLFMQKHWDVMRSDDAGESWREVSGNLPSDFGFPIAVHPLVRVEREVTLEVAGQASQRTLLDALEAGHPALRGTIRDPVTRCRRPFLRFFACGTDLSLEQPDAPLPAAVAAGTEPFLIVGAMAGG